MKNKQQEYLEQVKAEMESWRRTQKQGGRKRMPRALWQAVVRLRPQYPARQIVEELGLNAGSFYKYARREKLHHASPLQKPQALRRRGRPPGIEFVELDPIQAGGVSEMQAPVPSPTLPVELSWEMTESGPKWKLVCPGAHAGEMSTLMERLLKLKAA